MKRLLTLGILLLCCGVRGAVTNNISGVNCNPTYIASVISGLSDGDTVQLPIGPFTWNSTLTITKAINLMGRGTNLTILSGASIWFEPTANKPIRLSSIRFNNSDTDSLVVAVKGAESAMRIDHCMFNKSYWTICVNPGSDLWGGGPGTGPVYGVVDHCSFYNCSEPVRVCSWEGGSEYPNIGLTDWTRPIEAGTTNTVVYEDCYFEQNSGFTSTALSDPTIIYGSGGGRRCIRNCQFKGTDAYIDQHGDQPNNPQSVVFYEVYSNTFTFGPYADQSGDSFANIRGGSAIYHDNTFVGGGYSHVLNLVHYYATDVHLVTNVFWWNNTYGSMAQGQMTYVKDMDGSASTCVNCSTRDIHINHQYFTNAPQSTNYFYPYTPLVYPHPLVTAQDGGNTTTNAPTNLRIETQSANLSVGSALTLTANWDDTPTPYPDIMWWKTNDTTGTFTNIPGATLYQFTIASAQTTDSGWYEFSATNIAGGGTSAPVYISVTVPVPMATPTIVSVVTNWGTNFSQLLMPILLNSRNETILIPCYSYDNAGTQYTNVGVWPPDLWPPGLGPPQFNHIISTNYTDSKGHLDLWGQTYANTWILGPNGVLGLFGDSIDEGAAFAIILTNAFVDDFGTSGLDYGESVGWNGSATQNTLTVPSSPGDLVIDILVSSSQQFTQSVGQTLIGSLQVPVKQTWLQASYKVASDTNTTMGWGGADFPEGISHVAISVKGAQAPVPLAHPVASTNVAGSTFYVSSAAVATGDISYQWAKNSESITNTAYTGVQTTNLTLAHASWRDSGYYSVLTTNSFGIIASEPVYVEIAHPPYKAAGVGRMGRSRW